ncbi:MAG: hypothetical protein RCO49_01200 [Rickettsia endosymbiont of Argas persicus]
MKKIKASNLRKIDHFNWDQKTKIFLDTPYCLRELGVSEPFAEECAKNEKIKIFCLPEGKPIGISQTDEEITCASQ